MGENARVILVDDHALCRNGLTDLLHHRGRVTVVAALGDPEQVADALRQHQPDLLVLDLRMPTIDGLSLLRRLRAEGLETPALILTMSDSEADLTAALRDSTANTAASTRELRLSLDRMWRTCSLTVSWLMSSSRAIALLLSPRAR